MGEACASVLINDLTVLRSYRLCLSLPVYLKVYLKVQICTYVVWTTKNVSTPSGTTAYFTNL